MTISFYLSTPKEGVTPSAKEAAKSVSEGVPGATCCAVRIGDATYGFFSTKPCSEMGPVALLRIAQQLAPAGVVVGFNYKEATEEQLNQVFLTPDPDHFSVKFKGFRHLTPALMRRLAEVRPHLREIDLRSTTQTADLADSFFSRQQDVLKEKGKEARKALQQLTAERDKLVEERAQKEEELTKLRREADALQLEATTMDDLVARAKQIPVPSKEIAEYQSRFEEQARLKQSAQSEKRAEMNQTELAVQALNKQIEDLVAQIATKNSQFFNLDSAVVLLKVQQSDLTPENLRNLNIRYPHLVVKNGDSSLDLSECSLSLDQIKRKLLDGVKEVNLTSHQGGLGLFDLLCLEETAHVKVDFKAPDRLIVPKLVDFGSETRAPSIEEIDRVLQRFSGIQEVDLTHLKHITPLDLLYLQESYNTTKFVAPPFTECSVPLFDINVIERLCEAFPGLVLCLDGTASNEAELFPLIELFPGVNFRDDKHLQHLLEHLPLLKFHLKRALRCAGSTVLSQEDLEALAIKEPTLSPIVAQILCYRAGDRSQSVLSLTKTIDAINTKPLPSVAAVLPSKLPYSLAKLIERHGNPDVKKVSQTILSNPKS